MAGPATGGTDGGEQSHHDHEGRDARHQDQPSSIDGSANEESQEHSGEHATAQLLRRVREDAGQQASRIGAAERMPNSLRRCTTVNEIMA